MRSLQSAYIFHIKVTWKDRRDIALNTFHISFLLRRISKAVGSGSSSSFVALHPALFLCLLFDTYILFASVYLKQYDIIMYIYSK